jgi:hypothetical protein
MDKHQAQIRDGDEAARIINSPLFEKAFEDVRQTFIAALEVIPTTSDGDDQAKDVRRKLAVLAIVKSALTRRIDTGKLAQREISLREKASQGIKRFAKTVSTATGVR